MSIHSANDIPSSNYIPSTTNIEPMSETQNTLDVPTSSSNIPELRKRSTTDRRKFYKKIKDNDDGKGKYSSFFENLTKEKNRKSIMQQGNYNSIFKK